MNSAAFRTYTLTFNNLTKVRGFNSIYLYILAVVQDKVTQDKAFIKYNQSD